MKLRHDRTCSNRRWIVPALAIFAAANVAITNPARADCKDIDTGLRQAIKQRAIEQFPKLHQRMLAEPACHGAYRQKVGRVLALASLKILLKRDTGDDLQTDDLEQAAAFGRPWQVMRTLGDVYYKNQQWAAAAKAYEAAIDDMRDPQLNPKTPPQNVEMGLFKRAFQARALSDTHIPTRTTRGDPGGVALPGYRTFTLDAIPVAVRFVDGQTTLTPVGQQAAAAMVRVLRHLGAKSIHLTGHAGPADRQSGASDLQKLSLDRASSVGLYLRGKGLDIAMEFAGAGEQNPFDADEPAKTTKPHRQAFDQRVEIKIVQ